MGGDADSKLARAVGDRLCFAVPPEFTAAIRDLAARMGGSAKELLLDAFEMVLARWTE